MERRNSSIFSAEDLYRLPDNGLIQELVRGQLVSEPLPGARHGRVCSNVNFVLQSWARKTAAGIVYACDTGFVLQRDPDTVRGPDVAFVSAHRLGPGDQVGFHEGPPDLAVEVLSPGNRRTEMEAKIDNYLTAGALMVWIVDPKSKTLFVRTPDQTRTLDIDDTFAAARLFPELRVTVRELFE